MSAAEAESRVQGVIDLKVAREDPDRVRRSQRSRGEDPALVDILLAADVARRAAISTADTLRADQKGASKSVGSASPHERPTLLELAHQAQVGVAAATHTVKNLRRAGLLQICGTRRVAYRNRPVAEYAPASQPIELTAVHALQSTLHCWVKP